jgi:hypothetical protein
MSADRATGILARFTAAHHALVNRLREMPPGAGEQQPDDDQWCPAQIGCHVALTNEWVAAVLTGAAPGAQPAPPDFRESFSGDALPDKLKTLPPLEPPALVSRDAALERLRTSGQHLSRAIASLSPERGSGYVVALPFGTLSLFQLAEFAASHVSRHVSQVERVLVRA